MKKTIYLTLFILTLALVHATAYLPGTVDNEQLYAPLNLSAGTASWDLIGSNDNFTLYNGAAWKPGIWGNAIECDGSDDYLQTASAEDFPYSVSFFFKTTTSGATTQMFSTLNDNYFHINMTSDGSIIAYTQGGFKATVSTANNYYNNGSWFFIAVQDDLANLKLFTYSNGVKLENLTNNKGGASGDINPVDKTFCKGKGGAYWNGTIEDVLTTSDNLTNLEISLRAGQQNATPAGADYLNLTQNNPNGSTVLQESIIYFNATVSSHYNYSCSWYINDTLNQTLYYSNSSTQTKHNATFLNYGHYNYTVNCSNNGTSEALSSKFYINATAPILNFSDYVLYGSTNYTRNLTYSINITNCNSNNTIRRFINNTYQSNETFICNSTNKTFSRVYTYNRELLFNISFDILTEKGLLDHVYHLANYTFYEDRNKPSIINFTYISTNGFGVGKPSIRLTLKCNDSVLNQTQYNLTIGSGASQLIGNYTNNQNVSYNTSANLGSIFIGARCSDLFSTSSENHTIDIYARRICLINENTGEIFSSPPPTNITKAMAYSDDNQTNHSFHINNHPCINYTSLTQPKIRVELSYLNGDVITRYLDTSLSNGTLRVCTNPDPTTHYEQLIISAIEKPATLMNVYANCLVAQDYTRFVYQSSNILKAFTIASQYYLYTYDDDTRVYLASMDGSISSYYNLDVLEFNQDPTTFDITGDVVSFEHNNNELNIRYYNLDNNSVSTNVFINRVNDSKVYLNINETANPNNFIVYFDYDTLNLSNTTLLRIRVTTTLDDGTTRQTIKYFNTAGDNGTQPSEMVFILSILITIFGLTLTTARISLGWFGIVTQLISLIVLTLAPSTWYILLMMGVNVIILIYIVMLFTNQNYAAVV